MSGRAGQFGALLAILWAAHDLADHVVQTDHQATHKASEKPWPHIDEHGVPRPGWVGPMAGHVGSYTVIQLGALAVLRSLGVRPPLGRLAAAVAWSAGTHGLLDRRWPVIELLRRTGSENFARPAIQHPVPQVQADAIDKHGKALVRPAPDTPLPLHGPYLADQALHHAALAVAALILTGGHQ